MDRYRKEVLQVSTRKHGINVQYLYDILFHCFPSKSLVNKMKAIEKTPEIYYQQSLFRQGSLLCKKGLGQSSET